MLSAIFDEAHQEIFKLMERDNYARFKTNHDKVASMMEEFFDDADKDCDGYVNKEEFLNWTKANPESLAFITALQDSAHAVVQQQQHAQRSPTAPTSHDAPVSRVVPRSCPTLFRLSRFSKRERGGG